jgi:putative transposase
MKYNPDIHHRHSIRLKGYDYSKEGLYFITICTQNMEHIFGEIIDGKMILNNAGKMINKIYNELEKIFPNIKLHEYIIMPNHFHCIIEIVVVGADSISARVLKDSISARVLSDSISARVLSDLHNNSNDKPKTRGDMESPPTITTIPNIIQTFKRYTTIEYIKMVKQNILPPFDKHIWQRNYYEHIIRNEETYLKISNYIINNPLNWKEDKYNES